MKTLKKALTIAIAFNLIALLTNGCCCFCKKHCPPQSTKCKELIVDGNFEEPQMAGTPGSATPAHVADQENPPISSFGPVPSFGNNGWWHISPGLTTNSPCCVTFLKNDGVPQTPLQIQPQFWNTPDTNQFVILTWSDANFVVTTLSQNIATRLQAGKTYHLSFLQSAYNTLSDYSYKNPGKVLVELLPSSGGPDVYNKTFCVPPFSNWVTNTASINIHASGLYTIKFSNIDDHVDVSAEPVAFIDAVSLCDPN
jgi:hypothetical protein